MHTLQGIILNGLGKDNTPVIPSLTGWKTYFWNPDSRKILGPYISYFILAEVFPISGNLS